MNRNRQVSIAYSKGDGGFSLLELLVSLTLFSLVLLVLPGAFRTGKRGWETSALIEQSAASAAAADFLRHRIGEAAPFFDRDESGRSQLAFYGGAQELSFVAPAPSGPAGGGLYRFKLAAELGSNPGKLALVLRMSAYRPQSDATQVALSDHVLMSSVSSFSLRYFGEQIAGEPPAWSDAWTRTDRLPNLVEVHAVSARPDLTTVGPMRIELKLQPVAGA